MTTKTNKQEDVLWKQWTQHRNERTETALIRHYSYLVTFHVDRIFLQLPDGVNKGDIISYGYDGLLDAIRKFDPTYSNKFDTYASIRIRGAVMDGLRSIDWLPRKQREKTKKVTRVAAELEQQLFRTPTAEEIAAELGSTAAEVETLMHDMLMSNVLSMDHQHEGNESEFREGIGYNVPDDELLRPDQVLDQSEVKNDLVTAIKKLNERQQVVISLFYNDELTMTEIATILDVTTSRVSQIHKQAIFKLRNQLEAVQFLL